LGSSPGNTFFPILAIEPYVGLCRPTRPAYRTPWSVFPASAIMARFVAPQFCVLVLAALERGATALAVATPVALAAVRGAVPEARRAAPLEKSAIVNTAGVSQDMAVGDLVEAAAPARARTAASSTGTASMGDTADVEILSGSALPAPSPWNGSIHASVQQQLEDAEAQEATSLRLQMLQTTVTDEDLEYDMSSGHGIHAMAKGAGGHPQAGLTGTTWYGRLTALLASSIYFALIVVRCAGFLRDFSPRAPVLELISAPAESAPALSVFAEAMRPRQTQRSASLLCKPPTTAGCTDKCRVACGKGMANF